MAPIAAKNVITGTFGTIWVNGSKWGECITFEAKVALEYDTINLPNDGATYQKTKGWAGSGTMTLLKVYSRAQTEVANGIKSGQYPRFSLVGKVDDPDALGAQRVALHDVTVDEITLLSFDQKKSMDEQIPFKFSSYKLLDTIANPS